METLAQEETYYREIIIIIAENKIREPQQRTRCCGEGRGRHGEGVGEKKQRRKAQVGGKPNP